MPKNNKNKAVSVDNDVDERMVPSKHKGSGIYGEHMARYKAACGLVEGKYVLDIACGSGYGTAILGKKARSAAGVDISGEAISYAKKEYSASNIIYKKNNGKTIPFEDNTFDVVVSFETIEHLEDYNLFMKEVRRVLKDDGIFVLSTPNELEFAEGNHFHLHEFEHNELLRLAKQHYTEVKPYYQSTWVGNLIGTKDEMIHDWDREILVTQLNPITPDKFLYFYFLCSNRPITETIPSRFTISQHSSDRHIHEKDNLTQKHISNLEGIIRAAKEENTKLVQVINVKDAKLARITSNPAYRLAVKVKRIIPKL